MLRLRPPVRVLFTLAVFLGSALLFLVQPMVARMILPRFGGTPAVWTASMLFFQAALLVGYAYTHLSTRALGSRRQALIHAPLMALVLLLLPFGLRAGTVPPTGEPALGVLMLLASLVGLPFLAISAGAPLLQRWFADTRDPDAKDPYFLYSASNLGSMVALLGYPLLVEPRLRLGEQARLWAWGYGALVVLVVGCAAALWLSPRAVPTEAESNAEEAASEPVTTKQRLLWIALSAVPSSLLLGVTNYLTTNIAPVPLLWVVPLALYLLTFILVFARRPLAPTPFLGRLLPLLVAPLVLAIVLESGEPLVPLSLFHLSVFFVATWMCHARLSQSRPGASHLTEFYMWVAVGGVVGGAFNALVAPVVFNTLAEYPLAIVLACALRPPIHSKNVSPLASLPDWSRRWVDWAYPLTVGAITVAAILVVRLLGLEPGTLRTGLTVGIPAVFAFLAVDRPLRFALSLGALFLAAFTLNISSNGTVVHTERSFFGVHRVVRSPSGRFWRLVHGNTLHGTQDRQNPHQPLTYYYPTGPIGQVMKSFSGPHAKRRVALVGLGVGSLASYGEPGQTLVFHEIDPTVLRVARDPSLFTFLRDSKAEVKVELGDARLTLERAPAGSYGIIVLDAFSSDAIPIHLLTREAVQTYLNKLEPDGILAFHTSNRYLSLDNVLAAIAADLGLVGLAQTDTPTEDEENAGKTSSTWVLLARHKDAFKPLTKASWWDELRANPTDVMWTDDFSNILGAFKEGNE